MRPARRGSRDLRCPEDDFIYVPVLAASFEDAVRAVASNPDIISAVPAEGFSYRSPHDAPILRSLLNVSLIARKP